MRAPPERRRLGGGERWLPAPVDALTLRDLYGAASLILGRMRQAETSTRLKLLEIELGLAELRQELGRK